MCITNAFLALGQSIFAHAFHVVPLQLFPFLVFKQVLTGVSWNYNAVNFGEDLPGDDVSRRSLKQAENR